MLDVEIGYCDMSKAKQAIAIPVITFDGPSGVGKGTIAKIVADKLGLRLLDSGAIYRLAALASINAGIDPADEQALEALSVSLDIEFRPQKNGGGVQILLSGEDVTTIIRTEAIAQRASQIAAIGLVRQALLQRQRDFAKQPGLVADGRDMGTVVFPGALAKFYLIASAQIRAQRRYDQHKNNGQEAVFEDILSEIKSRDERDASRAVAPLKPADDAEVIDTSSMSIRQVELVVVERLQAVMAIEPS